MTQRRSESQWVLSLRLCVSTSANCLRIGSTPAGLPPLHDSAPDCSSGKRRSECQHHEPDNLIETTGLQPAHSADHCCAGLRVLGRKSFGLCPQYEAACGHPDPSDESN